MPQRIKRVHPQKKLSIARGRRRPGCGERGGIAGGGNLETLTPGGGGGNVRKPNKEGNGRKKLTRVRKDPKKNEKINI